MTNKEIGLGIMLNAAAAVFSGCVGVYMFGMLLAIPSPSHAVGILMVLNFVLCGVNFMLAHSRVQLLVNAADKAGRQV